MKFIVSIEVEVDSDKSFTESEGKRAAYDLAATLNQAKKGRTPSGPRASVCGISLMSALSNVESGPQMEMSKQIME